MSCESTRKRLLDADLLSTAARQAMADALAHAETCAACRSAVGDFDRLVAAGNVAAVTDPAAAAAPTGGWASFERRLQAAVDAAGPPGDVPRGRPLAAGSPIGSGRRARWRGWIGAAAAAAVVGFAGFGVGSRSNPGVATSPPEPTAIRRRPAIAQPLAVSDVARQVRAFDEIDGVFDGRARWLLLSAAASDVGLTDVKLTDADPAGWGAAAPPPAVATDTRPVGSRGGGPGRPLILVRLNLTRDDGRTTDADVVIVPGTTATVTVPSAGGSPLRYRLDTSAADPMRVSVRVELAGNGGPKPDDHRARAGAADGGAAVLGTVLHLRPYVGAAAGRLVTPGGSYDLRVAAAPAADASQPDAQRSKL